ncbi:MAG TPA: hypothetical protein VG941_01300 [Candidatus Paceibacterota bacterium]|nr:hypothetical protein [Candidatus Paceibacterota bacterium]
MNKKLWWVIGAIIVVVIAVWAVRWNRSGKTEESPSPSPSLISEVPVESPASGIGPSGSAAGSSSYTNLVAQYKDARIQFDAHCQAIPATVSIKNGTKIMFDNRSGDTRFITINGVSYRFPGYGYWIIPLTSTALPKTLTLNCGSAVNVGTIMIQK